MRDRACPLYRNAALITALAFALFCLVAFLVASGATAPLDLGVAQFARAHADVVLLGATLFATMLGTGPWLVGAAVVAALLVARHGRRAEAILPFLSLVGAWLGNPLLKSVFLRPRPTSEPWSPGLFGVDQYSFPSGHAMSSMALYSLLACWAWAYWPWRGRAAVTVFLVLMPIAIGASRSVLGVHWASDVVGGWLAGATVTSPVVLVWVSARGRPS